jgi:hypothetical protein
MNEEAPCPPIHHGDPKRRLNDQFSEVTFEVRLAAKATSKSHLMCDLEVVSLWIDVALIDD